MIRRDYILRMIEEFMQALSRIRALKQDQHWQEATLALDEEFNRLIGEGAQAVARLTETELLAKLIRGEPTQVVHTKTLMITTLLKQAGDLASSQGELEASRACYLKGLNLLLHSLSNADVDEFGLHCSRCRAKAAVRTNRQIQTVEGLDVRIRPCRCNHSLARGFG